VLEEWLLYSRFTTSVVLFVDCLLLLHQHLLNLIESVGDVSRGLEPSDIDKLPTKSFMSSDLNNGEPVPECNICISEYEDGDRLRLLQCTHKFHAKCVDRWLAVSHTKYDG